MKTHWIISGLAVLFMVLLPAHLTAAQTRGASIPVELLALSATFQDGVVLLSWITASEMQNLGFDIERRTETGKWKSVGFVEGHGSTMRQHNYGFTDPLRDLNAYCCRLRYRLRQADPDGRHEYSPEVEVRLDAPQPTFAVRGFPSPCDKLLTISIDLATAGSTNIRLHDIAGRAVMVVAQDAVFRTGHHSLPVATGALPSGLYLLIVEGQDGRRTEKVLIRH